VLDSTGCFCVWGVPDQLATTQALKRFGRAKPVASGGNAFFSSVAIAWECLFSSAFSKMTGDAEIYTYTNISPSPMAAADAKFGLPAGQDPAELRPAGYRVGDAIYGSRIETANIKLFKTGDLWELFKDCFVAGDWAEVNKLASSKVIRGKVYVENQEHIAVDVEILHDLLSAKVAGNQSDRAVLAARLGRATASAIALNSSGDKFSVQSAEKIALLKIATSRNESVMNSLFRPPPLKKD